MEIKKKDCKKPLKGHLKRNPLTAKFTDYRLSILKPKRVRLKTLSKAGQVSGK